MDNLPAVVHDKDRHVITADRPDVLSSFYYEPLEDDFFFFLIDIQARKPAQLQVLGDRESEYFILAFQLGQGEYSKKPSHKEGEGQLGEKALSLASMCYFFNNRFEFESSYLEGAHIRTLMLCVRKEWLERNLMELEAIDPDTPFMRVLRKEQVSMTLLNDSFYKSDLAELLHIHTSGRDTFLYGLQLRKLCLSLFSGFLLTVLQHQEIEQAEHKSDANTGINKVREYLETHFLQTFPGLEKLAEVGSMTVPTMRRQFMATYGQTAFDYFYEVQMRYAFQKLAAGGSTKEVALSLGYKNTGNFSRRFKQRYQLLPTEVKKLHNQ